MKRQMYRNLIKLFILLLIVSPLRAEWKKELSIAANAGTAKENSKMDDLGFQIGLVSDYFNTKGILQRENNNIDKGFNIATADSNVPGSFIKRLILDSWACEYDYNEAYNLNRQYVYKTLWRFYNRSFEYFKLRVAGKWDNWQDFNKLFGIVVNLGNSLTKTLFQYDTNLKNYSIFRVDISFTLIVDDFVRPYKKWLPSISPVFIYEDSTNTEPKYQASIEYRIKLNEDYK